MEEQLTVYTVNHKKANILWTFKYDLNGNLRSFSVDDRPLSKSQINFLFAEQKFPAREEEMKKVWLSAKKSEFEIIVGQPDLSFETFWAVYAVKQKKVVAEKLWSKLSKKDKIEALKAIPKYNNWLARKNGIQKQLPDTFLRQQRWLDNFNEH